MSLLIAIGVCAVGIGLLVYRYDMYEREPWYMLVLAMVMGAAAFWILGYAEDAILTLLTGHEPTLAGIAAVAGIMEELFKLLIVAVIWMVASSHFNDPFDGLIYGAMAGLGFALAESAFYIDLVGGRISWLEAMGQEAVRLILHVLLGSLTCVGLGLARFRVRGWPLILLGAVAISMLLHFCWDYFCGLPTADQVDPVRQRLIAVGLMLVLLGLFGLSVMIAVTHSGNEHADGERKRLWGWPFSLLARRDKD